MNASDKKLQLLGRQVKEASPPPRYADAMPNQRRQFVLQVSRMDRPTAGHWVVVVAAAAVLAIGAVWGWRQAGLGAPAPISFLVGQEAATPGSWVAATDGKAIPVSFAGGTRYLLSAGGAARVVAANDEQVIVDLAEGRIDCNVVGNHKTRWSVRAGGYEVVVTGTRFAVSWVPQIDQFNVSVTNGRVLVYGASLKTHGVALTRGDNLQVHAGSVSISNVAFATENKVSASLPMTPLSSAPSAKEAGERKKRGIHRRLRSQRRAEKTPGSKERAGWAELLANKDYTGAMAAARAVGLEKLANQLDANQLWQLSRAARFAGDGKAADVLLQAVVSRFGDSGKAKNAVFLLGRVNEELLDNPARALNWYEKYAKMAPGGALVEESLGRLMGVAHKSGQHQVAQAAAKRYLSVYPNGPFAQQAHSILK